MYHIYPSSLVPIIFRLNENKITDRTKFCFFKFNPLPHVLSLLFNLQLSSRLQTLPPNIFYPSHSNGTLGTIIPWRIAEYTSQSSPRNNFFLLSDRIPAMSSSYGERFRCKARVKVKPVFCRPHFAECVSLLLLGFCVVSNLRSSSSSSVHRLSSSGGQREGRKGANQLPFFRRRRLSLSLSLSSGTSLVFGWSPKGLSASPEHFSALLRNTLAASHPPEAAEEDTRSGQNSGTRISGDPGVSPSLARVRLHR